MAQRNIFSLRARQVSATI